MKITDFISGLFKPTKKLLTIAVIVAAVAVLAICTILFISRDEPSVDTEYLYAQLSKASELTAAKLNYTGMTEYKDSGIAFINKSDFIMVYRATVRAGINLDEIKISANDVEKVIYLDIPKAQIQEVKVDPSTIKYFDEKFALFNVNEKEDGNKAIALAEEAAAEEAANMGVLELADTQAETLIKGILANAIPDGYEIKKRT
ncbi:MAG: DUF4230 domain-containing protein [Eubacteriales bacterium]